MVSHTAFHGCKIYRNVRIDAIKVTPQEAQSRILWGLALTEATYAVLFS